MYPIIAKARADSRSGRSLPLRQRSDAVDAQRQFAARRENLVAPDVFGRADVMNAGHAEAARFVHRGMNHAEKLLFTWRRNDAIDKIHRRVFEKACGIAVFVAN